MATDTDILDTSRKLPQDIYNAIVPFCDGDWKALRLVNKGFELDATRLLFQELTVCFQERSMKRLLTVSKIKHLARHVQVLQIGEERVRLVHPAPAAFIYDLEHIYLGYPARRTSHQLPGDVDTAAFDKEIDYRQYQSVIDDYSFFATPFADALAEVINRYDAFKLYKTYGDLTFSEAKFLVRDQDFECLKSALNGLTNLISIHILSLPEGIDSTRSWGAVSKRILHTQDYQNSCSSYPCIDRRPEVLLRVLGLVNMPNIKELVVKQDISRRDCTDKWRELGLNEVDNMHILAARSSLAHLTRLDVTVGRSGLRRDRRPAPDVRPYKIANMLRGLPLLQHLALRNSGIRSRRIKIWPALAAVQPGHLKSISLECCILRPSVLQKFFSDHAKTLRQISLNRTYMHHGNMTWMFTEMRETMNLESLILISFLVELESTFDVYWDKPENIVDSRREATRKAISDYVTHRTNIFPNDLLDEQGPFGTGHYPGVVQVVGRGDFPDETHAFSHNHAIKKAKWWTQNYPDDPVDSYEDSETACNELIALEEPDSRTSYRQSFKSLFLGASDGTISGDKDFGEDFLRQDPASPLSEWISETQNYLRLQGLML